MRKKVTSKDVAKQAGVSRTTVSYILNNTEGVRISEETRKHVLEVARQMGYHLDINAQALKTNRSMSIGVVTRREISEARFVNVLEGIKEVFAKEKYSILLCSDEEDENGFPEYYRLYHGNKIDGIIFISCQELLEVENADKRAELIYKEQIPCVFIDYHLVNPIVSCVDINYFHGAYIATKYLISNGHKKIAFLVPDFNTEQERQRLHGVNKAVDEFNDIELLVYKTDKSIEDDFTKSIIKTLEDRSKFTALIVAWGAVSARTLYLSNKMNIEVPKELAIISLAGDTAAKYTYPALSTCELPLHDLGVRSAEILLESLAGEQLPVNLKLPCELNIREST